MWRNDASVRFSEPDEGFVVWFFARDSNQTNIYCGTFSIVHPLWKVYDFI